jgi:hypothetical protein
MFEMVERTNFQEWVHMGPNMIGLLLYVTIYFGILKNILEIFNLKIEKIKFD